MMSSQHDTFVLGRGMFLHGVSVKTERSVKDTLPNEPMPRVLPKR
jgi:hypothetical protein